MLGATPKEQLLKYKANSNKQLNSIALVRTFSSALPNSKTKWNFTQLRRHCFYKKTPIVAYCRDTNLQDILVHKKNKMLGFFLQQIQ